MTQHEMEVRFVDSISEVDQAQWNQMLDTTYPFIRHEFLHALEASNSVTAQRGWQPCHALVYQKDILQGAMPLYIKSHPYGEYVFDHIWEEAFSRHGLSYYPKLLTAIPFTPVRGPRYIVARKDQHGLIEEALVGAVRKLIKKHGLSSWHVLFTDAATTKALQKYQLNVRNGVNFFWTNNGYQSFDDFLATCNARKRKNIRKEREHVARQQISFRVVEGKNISKADWNFFYKCYQSTYAKRSGHGGYLTKDFFERIANNVGECALLFIAEQMEQPIGAALSFLSKDTLYGRYWGCISEVDKLHFETCYYQQMEYCIAKNIQNFDGGAQGEHKIQRGFVPTTTYSCHWIENTEFRQAITNFLSQESQYMAKYKEQAGEYLPFKQTDT